MSASVHETSAGRRMPDVSDCTRIALVIAASALPQLVTTNEAEATPRTTRLPKIDTDERINERSVRLELKDADLKYGGILYDDGYPNQAKPTYKFVNSGWTYDTLEKDKTRKELRLKTGTTVYAVPKQKPMDVNEQFEDHLRRNTVTFNNSSCSGWTLRNESAKTRRGRLPGVMAARHCFTQYIPGYTTDNLCNAKILPPPKPMPDDVEVLHDVHGDRIYESVGEVQELIMSRIMSQPSDLALVRFKGATTKQLYKAFEKTHLTKAEMDTLTAKGAIGMVSGYPYKNGDDDRQSFPLTLIGGAKALTCSGETFDMKLGGVMHNENGAVCTPGASGSGVSFIYKSVKRRKLPPKLSFKTAGVISTVTLFKPNDFAPQLGTETYDRIREHTGLSFDGYDANCGINTELPASEDRISITVG